MKEFASQKVSLGEKVGYSLGDAAANLVFQMMMIFQLKFYTDVFGLDGAMAGSILMIGSISAIIVDPTVGILSDHTNTRWESSVPGCCGQLFLSVCSTCWHSIILVSRRRVWWLSMQPFPMCC